MLQTNPMLLTIFELLMAFHRRAARARRFASIMSGDVMHRNGKRFVVRADEKLTAFVELESAIRV
jgi:hypothetical protein